MSSLNPLEKEILKYEKKGFKKDHKKTLKYGLRTYVEKGGIFTTQGVYFYYVDGDTTTESLRECFKDYEKFYENKNFDSSDKGIFLVNGTVDEKLFKDLRKAMIRDDSIRNSIKLMQVEGETKKKTKESSDIEEKPRRVVLTAKERLYVWEHPQKYGRKCSICNGVITKMSDLELDHTIPYSKGGTKMALAHRDCNKMKGSKNLKDVQTKMKFKT